MHISEISTIAVSWTPGKRKCQQIEIRQDHLSKIWKQNKKKQPELISKTMINMINKEKVHFDLIIYLIYLKFGYLVTSS